MNLPHVQLVRQIAPQSAVADVPAAVRAAWLDSTLARRIKPGMRVAVGCGSRGIKNYLAIAKATIDALKELGARPFVVAAMGSHGGATPEGQRELLASYHIDEAHLGVPVVTDMDAVRVGTNSWGEPVWWDKNALAADGVVLVNRVKPHTDFRGRYERGSSRCSSSASASGTGPTGPLLGHPRPARHAGRVGEGAVGEDAVPRRPGGARERGGGDGPASR